MLIGYARISKIDDQDTLTQINTLKAAGVKKIFEEKASGGRWDRPELHRMLDQLRAGDVIVVWKLDRLSRSLKDLLHIMEKIQAIGASFRSITEDIDTTTAAGRMMMQIVGSFAEFERAMIRERTKAGLETARSEGRIGGRKPKLTSPQKQEAITMVRSGKKTASEVARLFQVHPATISRLLEGVARTSPINVTNAKTLPLEASPAEKSELTKNIVKIRLSLDIENNNKYVRGKKRARESVELMVLSDYDMKKLNEWEYHLIIPYETEAALEKEIYEIISRANSVADSRNCFIEAYVSEVGGDRSWGV
jgi:DNA invertase Pin-like site-specific DNA recombinase